MTHASDAWLACGYDASNLGKATLTIDRSRAAMNDPSAVTANTATAVRDRSFVAAMSSMFIRLRSTEVPYRTFIGTRRVEMAFPRVAQPLENASGVRSKSRSLRFRRGRLC